MLVSRLEVAAILLYLVASSGFFISLILRKPSIRRYAIVTLALGFGVGMLALVFRGVGALEQGEVPFVVGREVFSLLAWILAGFVFLLQVYWRYHTVGALFAPFSVVGGVFSLSFPERAAPLAGLVSTWLLSGHIVVLLLGLSSFSLASLVGLMYLVHQHQLKIKTFGFIFRIFPPLETLDRIGVQAVVAGFVFLTAGIVSGIFLAHYLWADDWFRDPKFIFSVLTWAWYLLLLVARFRMGWRGIRFFVLLVVGFLFLLFTFLGLTSLLGSADATHDLSRMGEVVLWPSS